MGYERVISCIPINPYAACVANLANTKPWHMGTHLRVLGRSYPMNTNMVGFRWFSKIFASLCFNWTKVASALEGLSFVSKISL